MNKPDPAEQTRLRQNAAAMLAAADGKPVEARFINGTDTWNVQAGPITLYSFKHPSLEWRPQPEPSTRPWSKPEDVPLNCWIRYRLQPDMGQASFIVSIGMGGIQCPNDGRQNQRITWSEIGEYEHSTDRKTWLPCTVQEP